MFQPSDRASIFSLVLLSLSLVSKTSSSSPLSMMRASAVFSSMSTNTFMSGVGKTLSKSLYASFAGPSGRYATAMMYLTNTMSS